ncbi:HIRAN domain-containing protein [Micromonospora sp. NPDC047620]|uniref:HIRAN domain-containing protein n=1 Tax=Micromonospora sp. NPDC047620 TaxID=3364251 RepID=UPI00371AFC04
MSIPFDLWGQRGWANTEVAGEAHYVKQIRELFGNDFKPAGAEIVVTAQLLPEPKNRHDRNAVGVWAGGRQVGYLPREEAARYCPVLTGLVGQGWLPQVSARVWGAEWSDYDDRRTTFRGSVRLDLAEPHMLVPVNLPPSGNHRLLPAGAAIQVTGEEKHLDALASLLRPEGECWAYVSLHEVVEQSARASRTIVEVRVDGNRVGQLTPKMSGELLPAIRHLAEQDVTAAARAIVKGNRIKTEVVLYVSRAHELPDSWLGPAVRATPSPSQALAVDQVAPAFSPPSTTQKAHGPIPPPPTGVKFVVPAEWPQPPAGWTPPPGWRPDPSWSVAPDGWQWWVPVWE